MYGLVNDAQAERAYSALLTYVRAYERRRPACRARRGPGEITNNEWIRRVSLLLPVTSTGPRTFEPAYFGVLSSGLAVSTARHTLGAEHRPTCRSPDAPFAGPLVIVAQCGS